MVCVQPASMPASICAATGTLPTMCDCGQRGLAGMFAKRHRSVAFKQMIAIVVDGDVAEHQPLGLTTSRNTPFIG